MKKISYSIAGLAAAGLLGAAAWWLHRPAPVAPAPAPVAPPVVAAAPSASAAASVPAIRYPVEVPAPAEGAAGQALDVAAALADLFGRKAVLSMFQLDDFAHRFVATIDNLGRVQASKRLWPMNPAEGRFTVENRAGAQVIAADNGLRYTPYVLLLETVDLRQAASTYARLYPLFQQAYEELGYPKRYFNDRLVEVIDQLLATPEVEGGVKVHLPVINGPVQPERPWVLYEFDDPALQSLSPGQKIVLRMGPVNERRVKARLAEFRRLVAGAAAPR